MADPLIEASLVRHVLDGYFHRGNHRGGGTTPFFTTLLHFLNGALRLRASRWIYSPAFPPAEDTTGLASKLRGPLSPAPPIMRKNLTTSARVSRMPVEGNPAFPCSSLRRFPLLGSQETTRHAMQPTMALAPSAWPPLIPRPVPAAAGLLPDRPRQRWLHRGRRPGRGRLP